MVGSASPLPIFYSFNHTTPAIHYVPLRAVLWTMKKRLTGVWFNDPWLISATSKGLEPHARTLPGLPGLIQSLSELY